MTSATELTVCRIWRLLTLYELTANQQEIKQWRGLQAGEMSDVMQTESGVMQRKCRPIT